MKKITIAIFFHTKDKANNRKYWIGSQNIDGSCEKVIKNIRGRGPIALDKAVKYLYDL